MSSDYHGRKGLEWEIPKRNENGDWVSCGKKYIMVVLPEEEKQKYIEKMNKSAPK